ncbi:hypothetical protein [Paenibacillus sanguinis]|uniref:hypothetical protein n=1 Tax=Paenibacillus sanguinis TaxID=225906 RepID=UPI00037F1698|nr:hypothetical protein [Paenibacillus sanguinis]
MNKQSLVTGISLGLCFIGAERLGHSSVQIYLDRYSHLLPDMQRGAVDLVEAKMKSFD